MKPPVFNYFRPGTLTEALEHLEQAGDDGKLLAGGQSLVPMMNFRLVQPSVLIDMNELRELDFISLDEGTSLRIGAMVRQSRLEEDLIIRERAPLLAEVIPSIAHPQIRNRGTIGGSLVHADPAAELPVIAIILQARMKLQSYHGERWIPADEFFVGMFTTAIDPDEALVEIEFPPPPPNTGWAFLELSRRTGDYALAGVAAGISLNDDRVCQEARLVYLNAGDGPVVATEAAASLVGEIYSVPTVTEAARIASAEEISPIGNVHATPEYQRHLAEVLTRRVLQTAFERAEDALRVSR